MIKGNFHRVIVRKQWDSSSDHSDFVVEALNGAIGDFFFGAKPIEDRRRSIRATCFIGSRRLRMARKYQKSRKPPARITDL